MKKLEQGTLKTENFKFQYAISSKRIWIVSTTHKTSGNYSTDVKEAKQEPVN